MLTLATLAACAPIERDASAPTPAPEPAPAPESAPAPAPAPAAREESTEASAPATDERSWFSPLEPLTMGSMTPENGEKAKRCLEDHRAQAPDVKPAELALPASAAYRCPGARFGCTGTC